MMLEDILINLERHLAKINFEKAKKIIAGLILRSKDNR